MTQPFSSGFEAESAAYYQPSGRITQAGLLLTIVVGLAAGALLGMLYGWGLAHNPIHYLNFIATAIFGAAVGAIVAITARAGKLRSRGVVKLVALAVLAFALYVSWGFWVSSIINRSFTGLGHDEEPVTAMSLITSPGQLYQDASNISEVGTWRLHSRRSRSSLPVRGLFLVAFWITEAIVVFWIGAATASSMAKAKMFCESCNAWCTPPIECRLIAPGNSEEAKIRLADHDWAYLAALPTTMTGGLHWWTLTHEHCPRCNQFHAITLTNTVATVDAKGNKTNTKTELVSRLLVSPQELPQIVAVAPPVVSGAVPPPYRG